MLAVENKIAATMLAVKKVKMQGGKNAPPERM